MDPQRPIYLPEGPQKERWVDLNKISTNFEKAKSFNRVINKTVGKDIISSYKKINKLHF